jgi:hypothetical protein
LAIWNAENWNYRTTATRTVLAKSKNLKTRKILAEDVRTKLPLTIEVLDKVLIPAIKAGKEYTMVLKIYTAKSTENVERNFDELFQVLDVDQPAESFINAMCACPNLVRFELQEIEIE